MSEGLCQVRYNRLKIGFATKVVQRVSRLQTGSAAIGTLLGTIPGNREIEKFLHWQFRAFREHGEWFALRDSLAEFIAENVQGSARRNDRGPSPEARPHKTEIAQEISA